jgi:hypothetical protein
VNKKPSKKRRNKIKYPGFEKKYTTRMRQEYLDIDYVDQLNDDEKEWLNRFLEEELNSQFKNDGTDFNKTKAERKKIYDRENARYRDLYGILKNKDNKFNNKKLLNYDSIVPDIENELSKEVNPFSIENAYIDFLDYKEIEAMMLEYDLAMEQFTEETSESQELLQQPTLGPLEP